MENSTIDETKTPMLDVKNKKTVDIGAGCLAVSLNPRGMIHSVNCAHPDHGYITLSPVGQFSNDEWYNSDFVRSYRKRLAEESEGFGISPSVNWTHQKVYFSSVGVPRFTCKSEEMTAQSTYYAVEFEKSGFLVHVLRLTNHSSETVSVPCQIGGTFSLGRSSYGQLTEGGPIPMPSLENELKVENHRLTLANKYLPARMDWIVFHNEQPVELEETRTVENSPVKYESTYQVTVSPGETEALTSVMTLTPNLEAKAITCDFADTLLQKAAETGESLLFPQDSDGSSFIINRNLAYIMACCSVPVGKEQFCVITDHQLLPLSWNRDAFYMMDLLLEAVNHGIPLDRKHEIQRIVKGHLLWMFEGAQRPDGHWGRAYLTNGFCKDKVFQLDQQCYPLLEICRYDETFQDPELVERLTPFIDQVLEIIFHHKNEEKWLFRTGETPADDRADLPYHFSSQILLWHTLKKLAALNEKYSFTGVQLDESADHVKKDCLQAFIVDRNGISHFAYLTDLQGNHQFYHDANDLPTVLAPIWGFCDRTDAVWRNTMDFAFTEENRGGYYKGKFAGLGSVHTPHPWPLGDGQELLYSRLTGQNERFERVREKLMKLVQWDGLFSEAVDENTGKVASRHWFSWPGAFISTVLLNTAKERSFT